MKFCLRSVSAAAGLVAITLTSTVNLKALAQVAEEKHSPQSFQLPPELEQLAYFQGTWRCEQPAESSSSQPVALTWNVERDLNNFWYIGYAQEIKSETNPEPVNSREFLGYNATSQRLVRLMVVGNGNSLNLTSSGWQDEQLIWEGTLIRIGRQPMPLREVITRHNENKFAATYFVLNDTNEQWQPVINETCERQAPYSSTGTSRPLRPTAAATPTPMTDNGLSLPAYHLSQLNI